MITLKDISKEIWLNCRNARPKEFENVTRLDVEHICNIFMRRIKQLLLSGSLLAIKDAFLFRPNLQKRIQHMKIKRKKIKEIKDNAAYKSVGKNTLLDF